MNNFIETAKNNFFKREYKEAFMNFSRALKDQPYDLDAKIGVLLSDMAMDKEEEAMALFELYEVSRKEGLKGVDDIIESLLGEDEIPELIDEEREAELFEDGIEYQDFVGLLKNRESFQRALEDLMFSTRIIIREKEDFMEFVNLLIENDYSNLALNYLESALAIYPHESFFQETLKQLES